MKLPLFFYCFISFYLIYIKFLKISYKHSFEVGLTNDFFLIFGLKAELQFRL